MDATVAAAGPVLNYNGPCGGEVVGFGKLGSHSIRIYILEYDVKHVSP